MTKPVIAIVGRPNVGKSTLLNRLAGKRLAVISDSPGTTRDRIFISALWQGHEFTLIDTGGWQPKPSSLLEQKVKQQIEAAVNQANAIIFMVDAKDGVIAADDELADVLRTINKPRILAVNKVDSEHQTNLVVDFYRLGMGTPLAISAYHNRGIDELMNTVLASVAPVTASVTESEEIKLAIVGRPNVGKSTLLNALTGHERAIVHEAPGTTRDAIDTAIKWNNKNISLIDTAGIKRRGRVDAGIDYYSLIRALQAINRCDVALLLIDAAEFITAQDLHIVSYIIETGKGIVLLVNKWDIIPQEQRKEFEQQLKKRVKFMYYIPMLYLSAKSGEGLRRVLPLACQVSQERRKHLSDSEINTAIEEAIEGHLPPRVGTKRLQVFQAYQDKSMPASFVLQVNDPKLVQSPYRRYLERKLRSRFGFHGVPLQINFAKYSRRSNKKAAVAK
jgi:GTP-binding protein